MDTNSEGINRHRRRFLGAAAATVAAAQLGMIGSAAAQTFTGRQSISLLNPPVCCSIKFWRKGRADVHHCLSPTAPVIACEKAGGIPWLHAASLAGGPRPSWRTASRPGSSHRGISRALGRPDPAGLDALAFTLRVGPRPMKRWTWEEFTACRRPA